MSRRNWVYLMMRRAFAIILLAPLAVLFIGAMRISGLCLPDRSCVAAASTESCHEPGCPACHKPASRDKNEHSSCNFDCPLCALVTFSPFIRFQLGQPAPKIEYAVMPVDQLTAYHQSHWKPPDIAA